MAKVYAPNKQYTGVSAGVPFAGGVAQCNVPARLSWFREHGYRVEEPTKTEKESEAPDISKAPAAPSAVKAGGKDGSAGK